MYVHVILEAGNSEGTAVFVKPKILEREKLGSVLLIKYLPKSHELEKHLVWSYFPENFGIFNLYNYFFISKPV